MDCCVAVSCNATPRALLPSHVEPPHCPYSHDTAEESVVVSNISVAAVWVLERKELVKPSRKEFVVGREVPCNLISGRASPV